jgi:hypothetical protein
MTTLSIGIIAALAVVSGLTFFFAIKFGKDKKNMGVIIGLASVGPIVNAIKDLIPNKEGIDASEIIGVVGRLAEKTSKVMADPTKVTLDDCKAELAAFVKEEAVGLGVKDANEAMINGVVSALFLLIKNYPQILVQLKKVQESSSTGTK